MLKRPFLYQLHVLVLGVVALFASVAYAEENPCAVALVGGEPLEANDSNESSTVATENYLGMVRSLLERSGNLDSSVLEKLVSNPLKNPLDVAEWTALSAAERLAFKKAFARVLKRARIDETLIREGLAREATEHRQRFVDRGQAKISTASVFATVRLQKRFEKITSAKIMDRHFEAGKLADSYLYYSVGFSHDSKVWRMLNVRTGEFKEIALRSGSVLNSGFLSFYETRAGRPLAAAFETKFNAGKKRLYLLVVDPALGKVISQTDLTDVMRESPRSAKLQHVEADLFEPEGANEVRILAHWAHDAPDDVARGRSIVYERVAEFGLNASEKEVRAKLRVRQNGKYFRNRSGTMFYWLGAEDTNKSGTLVLRALDGSSKRLVKYQFATQSHSRRSKEYYRLEAVSFYETADGRIFVAAREKDRISVFDVAAQTRREFVVKALDWPRPFQGFFEHNGKIFLAAELQGHLPVIDIGSEQPEGAVQYIEIGDETEYVRMTFVETADGAAFGFSEQIKFGPRMLRVVDFETKETLTLPVAPSKTDEIMYVDAIYPTKDGRIEMIGSGSGIGSRRQHFSGFQLFGPLPDEP